MKILFTHLLNNYTGAPKVLETELKLLLQNKDYDISLLTSKTDGCLSHLDNIRYYDNGYRWSNNRFLLAILLALSEIRMFFFVLFHRFDVLYVNTVLPFGAAIAAKFKRKKIIYHVHEIYINPGILKRFYYKIMNKCADKIICVSQYVLENLTYGKERACVIYNPIESNQVPDDIDEYLHKKYDNKIIFMPTSLKEYKGINQFVELARIMSDYNFRLLCSVPLEEIESYFSNQELPKNLTLIGKQPKLFNFYREAVVSMNLSLQDKCIETFGLTLAESFDALTPAVAPNFGGPKEIISNGISGFLINPYNLEEVKNAILKILIDFETYKNFSFEAKKSIEKFSPQSIYDKINALLTESFCS